MVIFNDNREFGLQQRLQKFQLQTVDCRLDPPAEWSPSDELTTISSQTKITGPSTYNRGKTVTLSLHPSEKPGWRFIRTDLPNQTPIQVCSDNVTDLNRNITLSTVSHANSIRMTEHIIALKLGLELDCLDIHIESDDPPLFDLGEAPLVELLQRTGFRKLSISRQLFTVREDVAILDDRDGFLLFQPAKNRDGRLHLDVAIDFPTAIGQQRLQFVLNPQNFALGAQARTNCSSREMFLMKTIGKLVAKYRNFGYTRDNILIAGRKKYSNSPRLLNSDGKSLEAVWHRTCLDLVAALALLDVPALAGTIISYKSGHALDGRFMAELTKQKLLIPFSTN